MTTQFFKTALLGTLCTLFTLHAPLAPAATLDEKAATVVKDVSVKEAEQLIAEKKVVVVDVRTPEEFSAGHIRGATNINFQARDFETKLQTLDRQQSYLIHCAAGGRSAKVREKMKELKFKSIFHLEGGLKAWEKERKPVEK